MWWSCFWGRKIDGKRWCVPQAMLHLSPMFQSFRFFECFYFTRWWYLLQGTFVENGNYKKYFWKIKTIKNRYICYFLFISIGMLQSCSCLWKAQFSARHDCHHGWRWCPRWMPEMQWKGRFIKPHKQFFYH